MANPLKTVMPNPLNAVASVIEPIAKVGSFMVNPKKAINKSIKESLQEGRDARVNLYSEAEIIDQYNLYRDSLGLQTGGIFSNKAKEAFTDLSNTPHDGAALFGKSKNLAGTEFYASLHRNTRNALDNSLKKQQAYEDASNNYKLAVTQFEIMCQDVPTKYKAEALAGVMTEILDDASKAIKDQHLYEVQHINELFDNTKEPGTGFLNQLEQDLNISNAPDKDAQLSAVKDAMLADLDAAQVKQKEEFNKQVTETKNQLFKAMQKQATEMAFLALLAKNDKTGEMRRFIEDAALQSTQNRNKKVTITSGADPNKLIIEGVSIRDLPFLKTVTGSTITQNIGAAELSYTLEMNRRIFSPFYLAKEDYLVDMTVMAQAIKAGGYNAITMDVEFKDEETRLDRGRKAYEASILAGFPPDHIEITGNGKEIKPDELFKGHEGELQRLNALAAKLNAEKKDIVPDYKAALKDMQEVQAVVAPHKPAPGVAHP